MSEQFRIVHCAPEHIRALTAGETGVAALGLLDKPELQSYFTSPRAFSGFWGGRVIGAASIFEVWPGRAQAWAVFADQASGGVPRRAWPAITRRIVAELERAHDDGYVRIETSVRSDFAAGIAWAVRLGFEPASLEHYYGPDGASHIVFRRLRVRGQA